MATFNFNMLVFFAMVVASMAFHVSREPNEHVVGDTEGWKIPSYPEFYSDWASKRIFSMGDILYFNFLDDEHDVAEVSRDAYDDCNTTVVNVIISDGPGSIELARYGPRHYISTVHDDCKLNMKFFIYVPPSAL